MRETEVHIVRVPGVLVDATVPMTGCAMAEDAVELTLIHVQADDRRSVIPMMFRKRPSPPIVAERACNGVREVTEHSTTPYSLRFRAVTARGIPTSVHFGFGAKRTQVPMVAHATFPVLCCRELVPQGRQNDRVMLGAVTDFTKMSALRQIGDL